MIFLQRLIRNSFPLGSAPQPQTECGRKVAGWSPEWIRINICPDSRTQASISVCLSVYSCLKNTQNTGLKGSACIVKYDGELMSRHWLYSLTISIAFLIVRNMLGHIWLCCAKPEYSKWKRNYNRRNHFLIYQKKEKFFIIFIIKI